MLKIESYSITDVGKSRKNNEDNFFCNGRYKENTDTPHYEYGEKKLSDRNLYAVCDGMGGQEKGEAASLIAVKALSRYQLRSLSDNVKDYIDEVNNEICELILNNNGESSGSTAAILDIVGNTAKAYNIGDSRIYIFRNRKLKQLSLDHTQAQQMVKMGIITPEAAKTHKDRHILTQHLGIFTDEMLISPYSTDEILINDGDRFLLCSDGLTDMLDDSEIGQILNQDMPSEKTAKALVRTALENGGRDNVTVQVVTCQKSEKKTILSKLILGIAILSIIAAGVIWGVNRLVPKKSDLIDSTENTIVTDYASQTAINITKPYIRLI